MARVKCEHVVKAFTDFIAVHDFNIEIENNEFIVIVGPSGCGKSTTLRMIAGLEQQTAGDIYIGEQLVNDKQPRDRNIAMVFQSYALYPHMNVYDNMAFALKLRKFSKEAIDKRVKEAAEILGISSLLHRKPKELSGGQRQRVALGRAIVREPDVFLMDEPLSNLDAKLRVQMRTEIVKLHNRLNATTIYVTHDQIEAMSMADRIVVMKDGIIQQIADPQTIYDKPANKFVAGFIGTPPMNFLNCRIEKRDAEFYAAEKDMEFSLPEEWTGAISHCNGDVIFGVRPEAISQDINCMMNIKAVVEVVEPLGSETLLNLKVGGQSLVVRSGADTKPCEGQIIKLNFDLKKAHLFDAKTGVTLV